MKDILVGMKIYGDICNASWKSSIQGMSVKEIKKKYQVSAADMRKFLEYLHQREWIAADIFEMGEDGRKREVDWEEACKKCKNTYYIQIIENIKGIQEKIQKCEFDLENASFLYYMKNEDIYKSLKAISREQINREFVVCKGRNGNIDLEDRRNKSKLDWIWAIVKGRKVTVHIRGKNQRYEVIEASPRGLYYNQLLETYRCVFEKEDERYDEVDLKDILNIFIHKNEKAKRKNFNIEEYIKKRRTNKIVLKVYKLDGGKVFQKIKNRVQDSNMSYEEQDEFYRISFDADDVLQYTEVLKGHGKTVIVESPKLLRKEILDSAYRAWKEYEKLITPSIKTSDLRL